MLIAVDVSQIIYQTGVSVYTKNLVENLLKIDKENQYLLFGGSFRRLGELNKYTEEFLPRVNRKFYPLPPSIWDLWGNALHFPKIERLIGKIDVYHSSDWVQFASDAYSVTTVHDLAPILLRKITNPKIVEVHKRRLSRVVSAVNKIIVPSQATKSDLIRLGGVQDRIEVVPEAPDAIYEPKNEQEVNLVKTKYGILGRYCIAVGVNERKNTGRIIEAFVKAKRKDLKLVIVGHRYKSFHETRGVLFLGQIPTSDLPALYSGAEVLLYPSLYEGFGLPILEAMVCGCPVVTSNTSSMPEVAGRAAILVDPYSTDSISDGIGKAIRGKLGLVKKGYQQVKKFSWESTAKETLKVYESVR